MSSISKVETKNKFDALLKQALNKKRAANLREMRLKKKQNEVATESDSDDDDNIYETIPSHQTNKSEEVIQVDVHNNYGKNDNFLLQKFLNESTESDKPAIPLKNIRKHKSASVSSTGTYNIESENSNSNKKAYDKRVKSKLKNNDLVTNLQTGIVSHSNSEAEENSKELKKAYINNDVVTEAVVDSNSDLSQKVSKTFNEDNSIPNLPTDNLVEDDNNSELSIPVHKISHQSSKRSDSTSISAELTELHKNQVTYENERKGKRKHTNKNDEPEIASELVSNQKEVEIAQPRYDYKHVIGITVHKTDRLQLNSLVIHPVVKIHIINGETGEYLRKSDRNRSVVFYYENKDILYITPIISESYNLYEKHSLYPAWEETMIINEDIEYFLEKKNKAIILFELLDFVTFSEAASQFHHKHRGSTKAKGWHKIAWAFLKPLGAHGNKNVDKKLRLQLYYPEKLKRNNPPHVCDIFHWWSNKKWNKYPSSLHVSVTKYIPPEKLIETFRSKTPIHKEVGSSNIFNSGAIFNQTGDGHSNKSLYIHENKKENEAKSEKGGLLKLRYQSCKLPNKLIAELQSYEEGCLAMKFSNNGLYLACAVLIKNIYSLVVFSVNTQEEISKFSGHQGLIYDIAWSLDDQIIVTVSADCTACVWNFPNQTFLEILPHPSYVYACQISSKNIIATGCYDHIVRIWCYSTYSLLQELEEHKGYITSLVFNKKSNALYSADSIGVILLWKYNEENNNWNLKREFKLIDLRNTIIDQVLLHKGERRLLINSRDNIFTMDIKSGFILYRLNNSSDKRIKTACDFSYCGSFLFATSDNGKINVWNSELGEQIATYKPYNAFGRHKLPINCINFHPCENILVLSHYGHNLPILLVSHDGALKENGDVENNVGLTVFKYQVKEEKRNKLNVHSVSGDAMETSNTMSNDELKREKIEFKDVIQKIDQLIVRRSFEGDTV